MALVVGKLWVLLESLEKIDEDGQQKKNYIGPTNSGTEKKPCNSTKYRFISTRTQIGDENYTAPSNEQKWSNLLRRRYMVFYLMIRKSGKVKIFRFWWHPDTLSKNLLADGEDNWYWQRFRKAETSFELFVKGCDQNELNGLPMVSEPFFAIFFFSFASKSFKYDCKEFWSAIKSIPEVSSLLAFIGETFAPLGEPLLYNQESDFTG